MDDPTPNAETVEREIECMCDWKGLFSDLISDPKNKTQNNEYLACPDCGADSDFSIINPNYQQPTQRGVDNSKE